MNTVTKDMLAVIKHGEAKVYRTSHDSHDSGPFTVDEDAVRCGRLELIFHTKGAGLTPHFTLYNRHIAKPWEWPHFRSVRRGDPGYQIVLRAFAHKVPALQRPYFKPEHQNTPTQRRPLWQFYFKKAA